MVNVARPKATQGESKTTRGEGLVPRWGRGVARQNPPCQTTTRAFSYLGAPAPAGRHPDLVILAKARIHARLTLGNTSMEKPGTTTLVNVARPKATQGESKTSRGEGLVPSFGTAASSR